MFSSNQKGSVAEQAIQFAAVKCGVVVYRPVSEHSRADLLFETERGLWRVQCKWGKLSPQQDVVMIRVGGSWLSPNGYVRSTYSENEVDLLAVYCGELDRCFLLPIARFAGIHALQLRLTRPRNNQRACINMADDFDFNGAIAQLGERAAGSRKVVGSSPTSSTHPNEVELAVGCDEFRLQFGYWIDRVAAGEEVLLTRRGKPRIRLSPAV
jgi:PD-(D/E)XK endonuclease